MDSVKVSVLGYKEDGDWVAHALEMDVIGVGGTWEQALDELGGNIRAQVSFAKYRGDESLVFQPAPPEMFEKFRAAREAALKGLVAQDGNSPPASVRSDDLGIPTDIPKGEYVIA